MSEMILAIDQGTTSTTCLVVEAAASGLTVRGRATIELPQYFPQPGWVEHDLEEIWATCRQAITAALAAARVKPSAITAIGITNQRETTGVWDERGVPVHRAIVWQDRRTADRCRTLDAAGVASLLQRRTGLVLDPYFSGTKLAWLLDNIDGLRRRAQRGELRFGTIDTWLVWKLTGGAAHLTDATNASRTLLFDIHRGRWDPELGDLLGGVPASLSFMAQSPANLMVLVDTSIHVTIFHRGISLLLAQLQVHQGMEARHYRSL